MVTDRPPVVLEIDTSPVYELLVSVHAYVSTSNHKTLELPTEWASQVRQQLTPAFATELASLKDSTDDWNLLILLVWKSSTKESVPDFLHWFSHASAGELYETLTAACVDDLLVPSDLIAFRDRTTAWLQQWHDGYFAAFDPTVLTGLQADAARTLNMAKHMSAADLMDVTTMGMAVSADAGILRVVLIPQHHFRPWNVFAHFGSTLFDLYPADVLPALSDAPPPQLLRVTKALSDANRLRILRFVADGSHSFSEIVQWIGLSKGTVHHHLVALRAAGLVRVEIRTKEIYGRYTLRSSATYQVFDQLQTFLRGGDTP